MKKLGTAIISSFLVFFSITAVDAQSADHPISLYRRGVEARIQGNYYDALEFFQSALSKNPSYFDPVYASAEIYFLLEEYDQALTLIDRALGLAKGNIVAGILKGRILVGMGNIPGAAEIFRRVLLSEPNNVEARLAKAELDIAQGKNRNAAVEYIETLQVAPNNRRALLSLALLYQSQGVPESAREYFELAIRYHGDVPVTHLLAGEFFFRENRPERAEQHARIALSLKPNYEDALMLLGAVHLLRGRFEEVYAAMDEVLRLNRNNASAWYLKGLSALRMGKPKEGIDLFRTLLTIKPEDEIARLTLEDTLREFLPVEDSLRRTYGEYHFERGDRFRERNLFSRAFEEYRRGLQIDPYSKRGRIAYADILLKLGFQARSLNSLVFLKDQKLSDREVDERIEIAESLLEDAVARSWRIDQFFVERRRFSLSLFFDIRRSELLHQDAGVYLCRYFGDLLVGSPKFSLMADPQAVTGFGQAFQEARQRGSDYFVLMAFSETERELVLRADLYLSRTGGKIDSFQIYRTGNDRVQSGLVRLSADFSEKFPLRGNLLQRDFERGLVSLGRVDGIKEKDTLIIISDKDISLKHDTVEFVYKPEEILGTLTVTRVDDLVSEGIIEKKGFFDRLNPGDAVIPGKLPEKPKEPQVVPDIPLYKRILRIQ